MTQINDLLKSKNFKKAEAEPGEQAQITRNIIEGKICPVMSTRDVQVACTPQCQWYKHNSHGYECPIQEANVISYQLREFIKWVMDKFRT